jgi:flagellar biosynthesis protein FliR
VAALEESKVLGQRCWVKLGEFLVGILIGFCGRFFTLFWTILGHELNVYKGLLAAEG